MSILGGVFDFHKMENVNKIQKNKKINKKKEEYRKKEGKGRGHTGRRNMSHSAERTHFLPHVEDAPISSAVHHLVVQTAPAQSLAGRKGARFPATEPAVWHTLIIPIQVGVCRERLECGYVSQVGLLSTCFQEQHLPVCHFRQPAAGSEVTLRYINLCT